MKALLATILGLVFSFAVMAQKTGETDYTERPIPPGFKLPPGFTVQSGDHLCGQMLTNGNCNDLRNAIEKNGPIDIAKFTPRGVANAVAESEWKHLGESKDASYWYAYWEDNQGMGTGIVLKSATKSIGAGYTIIEVMTGFVNCLETKSGNYPTYMSMVTVEIDDATTGYPPPGYSDVPLIGTIPLQRGTAIAGAVKASCDAVASR